MSTAPLGLDPALWQVLACPCDAHGSLKADEAARTLTCTVCGLVFPVRDGIPVMLIDEATTPGQA
ncbi:MAG: Trm112 family protein [Actinomycetota bacterium]|nr:Trm112 family protein [Actinomycetota bacterium]MDP2289167.1 Trm112 family protein [Actinomycetota bacterium]